MQHNNNQLLNYRIWLFAFFLYSVTAWFSEGYHHPDEHFQILEFANLKMGRASVSDMPWEWREQMRPGLQPWITVQAIGCMESLGCFNPFTQLFILRLLSGWLMLLVLYRWAIALSVRESAKMGTFFAYFALFLWCMPYLGVRFSSEGLTTTCFLGGALILYEQRNTKWALLGGLLLGLSFELRFQMGFAIAGAFIWLLTVGRQSWKIVIAMVVGGLLSVALGTLADHWMYGSWVFVPYQYLYANIISGRMNAAFGVEPFWWYLPSYLIQMAPPISLVVLVLAIAGFNRMRTHLLIWAFVPFVMVHLLIGHKEMRFLFPAWPALLLLAAAGYERCETLLKTKKWFVPVRRFLLIVNTLLLVSILIRPALDATPYYHFLYRLAEQRKVTLYAEKTDPYQLAGLNTSFYDHPNIVVQVVGSMPSLLSDTSAVQVQKGDLVLINSLTLPQSTFPLQKVYCYFPDWIKWFNFGNWQSRTRIWTIYER